MPSQVDVVLKCLEPGCDLPEQRSSVGWSMTDAERFDTADAHVWFAFRHCRTHHAAGVEARFTDEPHRRIVFSMEGGTWHADP